MYIKKRTQVLFYFIKYARTPTKVDPTINIIIIIPIILATKLVFFFFFLLILYTSIIIIHKNWYKYNKKEYNFMGEDKMKKYSNIKSIILPNKRINIFVICLLFLGVIAGAIFAGIIGMNDKTLVIEKIKLFIDNINNNSLNSIHIFKNSISINLIYITIIWLLGMALLGIICNIFILFIKSFIFGFSISAFILTYSYKGLAISFLYLIFGQLLNLIIIIILTIYSITFSYQLLLLIFKNNSNIHIKKTIKNYFIIFIISIILSIISSISESFILPALIKLIIKLYV